MSDPYKDILTLPYPRPSCHQKMPPDKRAAQFAPFQALTGYEDEIQETGRTTDAEAELSEDMQELLQWDFETVEQLDTGEYTITYFVLDGRKSGGEYREIIGTIAAIDKENGLLICGNGLRIPFSRIYGISAKNSNSGNE